MFPVRYDLGFYILEDGILVTAMKTQILHSINRLGSVAETECVSSEVRAGFFRSHKTAFFIATSVKTLNLTHLFYMRQLFK
jgi:hypothetical protein